MTLRAAVLATALLGATAAVARADGLDLDVWGARSIARAGATVVSEDGAAALLLNPAGLVRRSQWRAQVGMAFHDDDARFRAADADTLGAPDIDNRAAPLVTPSVGVQGTLGPLVFGASYIERGDLARRFPSPRFDQPVDEIRQQFPHRYAGTALRYQHHSVSVGAAVRASSWLGIGVSASVDQMNLAETRFIWAGFDGRDGLANPSRDLELTIDGTDNLVWGAGIGVLLAPPQLPLEMALSANYVADAKLDANVLLASRHSAEFPRPEQLQPAASARLSNPLRVRAGLRYLGDRVLAEADGELGVFVGNHASPRWRLHGVFVRDDTDAVAEIATVPSLIDRRSYAGARASIDVEVVSGFVWLTAGYAYRTGSSRRAKATAGFADLGGHTIAGGAEGQWNGMTLSIGYARFIQPRRRVQTSAVPLINPFDGGTMAVGNGRYDGAHDAFGVQLEVSWD